MDWMLTDKEILETAREIGTSVYPLGNSDTEKYMNWQRTIWYEIAKAQARKLVEWLESFDDSHQSSSGAYWGMLIPSAEWESLKKEVCGERPTEV